MCIRDRYGISIKFNLWDTAGQEKYRSLGSMYYQDANAAILVYNITDRKSFEGVAFWMTELKANAPETIKIFIAANKSDLIDQEAVSLSEGKKFAEQHNATFQLTSAKDGSGIEKLFSTIPEVLGLLDPKAAAAIKAQATKGVSLDTNVEKKKDGCC
eukprot:TRINITY_DN7915_c0_g2_i3.p1 TRINITY_DN7915_c0_g2~~TRINITY_DN7915_c0_g2_i3.p1  ORF type:complete len:157 (-),score=62.87 TRINITY_DN7915_c0_g2_i3:97-567(-)